MSELQPARESMRRHRREVLRQIALPAILALILIVACVTVVILFPRQFQVSIVSDVMVMVFMLCPAVLCLLPMVIALIVGVFGMNRAHGALAKPLGTLESYSQTLAERTATTAEQVNRQTIETSSRLGVVYKLLGKFESPEEQHE